MLSGNGNGYYRQKGWGGETAVIVTEKRYCVGMELVIVDSREGGWVRQ